VSVDTVVNGIASVAVTVVRGIATTGEATSGSGAGANGPTGDSSDNLNLNFGFTPTYSIGNRVYRDRTMTDSPTSITWMKEALAGCIWPCLRPAVEIRRALS